MKFRITRSEEPSSTVLKVDGQLMAGAVGELLASCRQVEGPLTLDLEDLMIADDAGLEALRDLDAGGVRLRNLPPYVALRMKARSASSAAGRRERRKD